MAVESEGLGILPSLLVAGGLSLTRAECLVQLGKWGGGKLGLEQVAEGGLQVTRPSPLMVEWGVGGEGRGTLQALPLEGKGQVSLGPAPPIG